MSRGPLDELGELAAALCDGRITAAEAQRLESLAGGSADAMRYLVQYLQLHGELHWDHAAGAGEDIVRRLGAPLSPEEAMAAAREAGRAGRRGRWLLLMATIALSAVLIIVGWRAIPVRPKQPAGDPSPASAYVAQITATIEPRWAAGDAAQLRNARLLAGQELQLQSGLAELTFASGARLIFAGPAVLYLDAADQAFLSSGRATAVVANEPQPFKLRTPDATISGGPAVWGVHVPASGPAEVHVFEGGPTVYSGSGAAAHAVQTLEPGQSVRLMAQPGKPPSIVAISSIAERFVRAMPVAASLPGSVAAMRESVSSHPHLIHHYTFEGTTREEKCRDKQGGLHVIEVVMSGGRGGGMLDYASPGADATTDAVEIYRGTAEGEGDTTGVALQSEERFQPPHAMTLELLLQFTGFRDSAGGVAAVVATRDSRQQCSFFLAAADRGQLVHLFDGNEPWLESDFEPIAGEWYYVASTFQTRSGETRINTFVANLTRNETSLTQIVRDGVASGTPVAGRLGIGKALDESLAHAYPWAGRLDELAIYDAALEQEALEEHLQALTVPEPH
jgi:hypothetical protein